MRGKMTLLPQFSKRYVALPGESLVCPMKLALDEADFANARKERAKWNKQIKETAKFLIEDKLIDVPKLTEFSDRIAQTFTTWKMAYGNAFDKVLLKIASAVKKVKEQPKSVFEVLAQWHKHVTDARNLCECGGVVILTNRNPRNWHCFTCGRNYVDIKVRMPCGKGGGPPAPRREA